MQKNQRLLPLLLMALLFICYPALAQDATTLSEATSTVAMGSNEGGDVSVIILKTLFAAMPIFGGGTDGLSAIFSTFSYGLSIAAVILLSYVVGTALFVSRRGEAGGKYNLSMMTLRSVFGTAVILPVANGYMLINVLTMYLILHGIGFTNAILNTYVSNDTFAQSIGVSTPMPNTKALVRNVLLASMCMKSIQAEADFQNDTSIKMAWTAGYGDNRVVFSYDNPDKVGKIIELMKKNPDKPLTLKAGNSTGTLGIPDNACGTIEINQLRHDRKGAWEKAILNNDNAIHLLELGTAGMIARSGANASARNDGRITKEGDKEKINREWSDYKNAKSGVGMAMGAYSLYRMFMQGTDAFHEWDNWLTAMSEEHANATELLLAQSDAIADSIINTSLNKEAEANRAKFNNDIDKARAVGIHVDTKQTKFNEAEIALAIDGLSSTYLNNFRAAAVRSAKGGSLHDNVIKQVKEYGWFMSGYMVMQVANLNDSINQIALDVPSSTASFTPPNVENNREFNSRYMSKINQYFEMSKTFANDNFRVPTKNLNIQDSIQNDSRHQASGFNLGLMFEDAALGALNFAIEDNEHPLIQLKRLGSLMISTATFIFTLYTTANDALGSSSMLIVLAVWGLLSILVSGGISLAYVLPMIPALTWTGMLIGWLFMVIEMMVIMPIWAITNISLHQGEDFIGNQKVGYVMIMTMILRPPLMTLGVIMMMTLLNVFGFFINGFYTLVYSMSQVGTDGVSAVFIGMIVAPLMYGGMVYIVIKEILSLMHKIPDNTLSVFGGGGQSLGQYGEKLSGGSTQVFGVMNNQIGNQMHHMRHNMREVQGEMNHRNPNSNNPFNFGGNNSSGLTNDQKDQNSGVLASITKGDGDTFNNGFQHGSISKINAAIDKGVLGADGDSLGTLKNAKDRVFAVPNDVKENAVNKALAKAEQQYHTNQELGINAPMSYDDFMNDVNNNINQEMFGEENAGKMAQFSDMQDIYKGNNFAGTSWQGQLYDKINDISERTGQDPRIVANAVGNNITDTFSQYAADNGYQLFGDGSNPSSFNRANITNAGEERKMVRDLNSYARQFAQTSGEKADKLKYQQGVNNNKIYFSSSDNYTKDFGTPSVTSIPVGAGAVNLSDGQVSYSVGTSDTNAEIGISNSGVGASVNLNGETISNLSVSRDGASASVGNHIIGSGTPQFSHNPTFNAPINSDAPSPIDLSNNQSNDFVIAGSDSYVASNPVNPVSNINTGSSSYVASNPVNPVSNINTGSSSYVASNPVNPISNINTGSSSAVVSSPVNPVPNINTGSSGSVVNSPVNPVPNINTGSSGSVVNSPVNPVPNINTGSSGSVAINSVNPMSVSDIAVESQSGLKFETLNVNNLEAGQPDYLPTSDENVQKIMAELTALQNLNNNQE